MILIRSCVTLAVLNASYLGFSAELILGNGTMYPEAGPTISAFAGNSATRQYSQNGDLRQFGKSDCTYVFKGDFVSAVRRTYAE